MESFRVTDAAPAVTGLAARLCPVVAALGGTSSTQTLASRAGTTMAFRSGRHNGGTGGFRSFVGAALETSTAVVVLSNTARSVDRLGLRLLKALSSAAR
jgi:hypothetical protein